MPRPTLRLAALGAVALLLSAALAAERAKFLTDDPYARNVITITSEAPLETIVTRTQEVTGNIEFDPDNVLDKPLATFELETAKLDTGIALRNEHLRGAAWLDIDHFPKISFALKQFKSGLKILALPYGAPLDLDGIGTVTIKGQAVDLPVTLTVTRLAASAETAKHLPGDLLKVSAAFDLLLSDFGIEIPAMAQAAVANRQHVEVRLLASTQKLAPKPQG